MMSHRSLGRLLAAVLSVGLLAAWSPTGQATTVDSSVSRGQAVVVQAPQAADPVKIADAPLHSWSAGGLLETRGPVSMDVTSSPGFAQVGSCTFYASNSGAGGWCSSGGTSGVAESLRSFLSGRKFVECRFFEIPDGMYVNARDPNENGRYMLKACFKDYDESLAWGGQDTRVEIFTEFVPYDRDITIPGYMRQFWDYQASRNYYPIPRIIVGPYPAAKVNTYTYFWAEWVEALDSDEPAEPDYRIAYDTNSAAGTVYLHASIGEMTLHPGLEEMESKECGHADVPFDPDAEDAVPESEGGDQESECWLMYEHSSAFKESQTVQFRVTAEWNVRIEDGEGNPITDLGNFRYGVDQRLAISEVQPGVEFLEDD